MKTKRKLSVAPVAALLLAALCTTAADASSWRVNSNAARHAHFADINAAMSSDNVQAGDTLYLDPGCMLTATQNVTKQVAIIGTGFFLDTNVHQEATVTGNIYLKTSGIKVEGVNMCGTSNATFIEAGNVTIERCKARAIAYNGSSNAQYVSIRQCYVTSSIGGAGKTNNNTAYWTVENNIIVTNNNGGGILYLYNATIRNNYVRQTYRNSNYVLHDIANSKIIDNILMNAGGKTDYLWAGTVTDCVISNNVAGTTISLNLDGNKTLGETADETLVFALEGSNDVRYQLKEDSPARGYATDGGDCGPYGGLYPYVPSGYPLGMPHLVSNTIGNRAQDGQVIVNQQVSIQKQ